MKYKFLFFALFFSFCNFTVYAQSAAQKNRQEIGLALYNLGFGGITAGFGALINKKKGANNFKTFMRGFKYGCIGGAIDYGSKRIDFFIYHPEVLATYEGGQRYLIWGWPTKIVHGIGSSIIYNAAQNRDDVFKNYNMQIGFINLNVNFEEKLKIKPQLMPIAFGEFVYYSCNKYFQFKPKESLLSGNAIFMYKNDIPNITYRYYSGKTFESVIALNDYLNNPIPFSNIYRLVLAHENIHALQFKEYQVFNNYFIRGYNKILNNKTKLKNILNKYFYCDIPFQNIFYILNTPKLVSPTQTHNNYYKNLFELEAQHFATDS